MIKYIVYWILVTVVPTECPDSGPDEFGRTSMISCAVFHTRLDSVQHAKSFDNRVEAVAFYNKALKASNPSIGYQLGGSITSVKMDSSISNGGRAFGYSSIGDTTTGSPCSGVGKAYKNKKN